MPGRGGGRPAWGQHQRARKEGGGGVARIGEEVESEAFQKQVKGEKYICQLAAVRWSAGWVGRQAAVRAEMPPAAVKRK